MGSNPIFSVIYDKGDVLQLAECMLCKHKVTGSNPVISSAFVAQLAEQLFCKQQVVGSSPSAGFSCSLAVFASERVVDCCVKDQRDCTRAFVSRGFCGFLLQGIEFLGGYRSGQTGQTVNLLAMPSQVRILHPPLLQVVFSVGEVIYVGSE